MRPTLSVLEQAQILSILDQAKEILSTIGMEILGPSLRARLQEYGLELNKDGRILFPPSIVDQAIAAAPQSFTLYNRDGEPHAQIGGSNVHFVPGSSGLRVLDHRTAAARLANTADFVEYVRLADGLPHITNLATAFSTNDLQENISDAWRLFLCLTNSKKPVVSGAFTEHGVPRMAQMMQLFRQDLADLQRRPLSIFTITATGNFRYSADSCQNLLDCISWGIPIEITPVTLMGLIAPVTVFEAAIFHTADVLAGLTMAQIIRPGASVLFGGAPATFHMQAATSPMSAVEAQQLNMAYIAVAKYLGLPTQAYMALSDSKTLDAQAGAETMSQALLAAIAGINSVSGPGMLDYVLVFSLPKLLLDNEFCGQALHFVRRIAPVDHTKAIDLARQVIAEQHLITAEHTLTLWPDHLHMTDPVLDRANQDAWTRQGRRDLVQRAAAGVEQRLAAYEPVPTDPNLEQELLNILTSGFDQKPFLPEVPQKAPKPAPPPGSSRRPRKPRL